MSLADKLRTMLAAATGDSASRYVVAERLARRLHPEAILSELDRKWLRDEQFLTHYRSLDPLNMRRLDRAWNLAQFVRQTYDVPGDTAECGVFRGLTSFFICQQSRGSNKTHHAFDSFDGVSEPSAEDGHYWSRGDLATSAGPARAALAEFPTTVFHVGWIPEQFHTVAERTFSFVHIDVDLYQPTLASLEFFLPRTSPGGLVLLDDYGFATCPGARQAADEACGARGLRIVELSSGQGLVVI